MLIRLLEDLRFVIGLFFFVIGLILVAVGAVGAAPAPVDTGLNLNLLVGGFMVAFSLLMFALTFLGGNEEEELADESDRTEPRLVVTAATTK